MLQNGENFFRVKLGDEYLRMKNFQITRFARPA